jgi:DNA adenine methylase
MRYFGGKVRLARELSNIINTFNVKTYHEPFCGMFSVGSLVKIPARSAADTHPDLIKMLQAVRDGWGGPEFVTEEEYQKLKTEDPSVLRGFVGFGCSNSGKFFGGYARDSTGRNYAANARSSLIKLAPKIQGVDFRLESYQDMDEQIDLIYCDPPYEGTTGFTTGPFSSVDFWKWVREQSRRSIVLVSEYTAPDWASVLWEKKVRTDMNAKDGGKISRVEKLFTVGN